jgi:hypothetical protein
MSVVAILYRVLLFLTAVKIIILVSCVINLYIHYISHLILMHMCFWHDI